jgi:4-amino-4-deoxy-L-arabinose transferase-like glycosyltransferase
VYLFRFAKSVYTKNTAQLAVLIYVSAAHLVISNNDVRAEPYLTALTIGSVYHFRRVSGTSSFVHLLLGSLLAACAVMTKGPFILITIGAGFLLEWSIRRQWRQIFSIRWLCAFLLIVLFITPELYCLYQQFDLHPEKVVFGRTGVSGLYFFLYDSQFGRFFNTGPIKGKGDPSFYLHTLLWAFLPWSLILYAAIFTEIKNWKKQILSDGKLISLGAALVTLLIFSASRFQLPHYSNILFPFFCVISADYLLQIVTGRAIKTWSVIQTVLCALLGIVMILLTIVYKAPLFQLVIVLVVLFVAVVFFFSRRRSVADFFLRSFLSAILVYAFLNIYFYPNLLKYQSGSEMAAYINKEHPSMRVGTYNEISYSLEFYVNRRLDRFHNPDEIKDAVRDGNQLLVTNVKRLDSLSNAGISLDILRKFPHYRISKITGKFLSPATRGKVLDTMVVAAISPLSK